MNQAFNAAHSKTSDTYPQISLAQMKWWRWDMSGETLVWTSCHSWCSQLCMVWQLEASALARQTTAPVSTPIIFVIELAILLMLSTLALHMLSCSVCNVSLTWLSACGLQISCRHLIFPKGWRLAKLQTLCLHLATTLCVNQGPRVWKQHRFAYFRSCLWSTK